MRRWHPLTKIVSTVGPSTDGVERITELIQAGVSVFRINFSHGEEPDHARRVAEIREAAAAIGRSTGILGDLPGPKIRVRGLPDEGIEVARGGNLVLTDPGGADPTADPPILASTYENLVDDLQPGQRVLINDGAVRLLAVELNGRHLTCSVTHGGLITRRKGINLPDTDLSVSPITDRDRELVAWAIEHDLDFLAMSFVRRAEELHVLRRLVDGAIPLIAKIEQPQAVENIDDIIDVADGVMVARGDLGVELDLARVPVIQKQIIETAHAHGKPCIVATQMLESMISAPAPTRAEASDVANAIFAETDAVMLSGETAVGKFPVVVVETMRRIAEETESYMHQQPSHPSPPSRLVATRHPMAALAHGVWNIARDYDALCVIVWSQTGAGARHLSQNNFRIPIVAISSDERALRQMQLLRGVRPVRMDVPGSLDEFTRIVDEYVQDVGWAKVGDRCVLVAGTPVGSEGVTNSLALHTVGDPTTGFG